MDDPYIQDTFLYYSHYNISNLFPKKTQNKMIVYTLGVIHLIGALVLQYAPYILSPVNLGIYLIYALLNIIGYYLFDNRCFMTLLTNYYGKINYEPLRMRRKSFLGLIIFNMVISTIGYFAPSMAPINWFKLFSKFL
jgi:hypothetical protein